MKRFNGKKRIVAAAASVAMVAAGAGAAFAYFTSTGSGTGAASVGTSAGWSVTSIALDATSGPLYPGAGSEVLSYQVNNTGGGYENLSSAGVSVVSDTVAASPTHGDVYDTNTSSFVANCLATWFVVDNTNAPTPGEVQNGHHVNGSASITMTDAATTQDACNGVAPQLHIAVS